MMLHFGLMDCANMTMMSHRRKVFNGSNDTRGSQLLIIIVGWNVKANLCGDLGGGFMLGSGSTLTLACNRLLRITGCSTNEDGGSNVAASQSVLASGRVQDVTTESEHQLAIYSGEITLLVTDGAKSLAYYIH